MKAMTWMHGVLIAGQSIVTIITSAAIVSDVRYVMDN